VTLWVLNSYKMMMLMWATKRIELRLTYKIAVKTWALLNHVKAFKIDCFLFLKLTFLPTQLFKLNKMKVWILIYTSKQCLKPFRNQTLKELLEKLLPYMPRDRMKFAFWMERIPIKPIMMMKTLILFNINNVTQLMNL